MRAVVITKHGGPEVLQVQERPDPAVGAGDVRIAVKAAGINFADTLARTGLYPDSPKVPCVVGYEVAGEVESVGEVSSRSSLAIAFSRVRGSTVRPSWSLCARTWCTSCPRSFPLRRGPPSR